MSAGDVQDAVVDQRNRISDRQWELWLRQAEERVYARIERGRWSKRVFVAFLSVVGLGTFGVVVNNYVQNEVAKVFAEQSHHFEMTIGTRVKERSQQLAASLQSDIESIRARAIVSNILEEQPDLSSDQLHQILSKLDASDGSLGYGREWQDRLVEYVADQGPRVLADAVPLLSGIVDSDLLIDEMLYEVGDAEIETQSRLLSMARRMVAKPEDKDRIRALSMLSQRAPVESWFPQLACHDRIGVVHEFLKHTHDGCRRGGGFGEFYAYARTHVEQLRADLTTCGCSDGHLAHRLDQFEARSQHLPAQAAVSAADAIGS